MNYLLGDFSGAVEQAAMADVAEALRRDSNYAQAQTTLRARKSQARWTPWLMKSPSFGGND